MEKERAREMGKILEAADMYVVIAGENGTVKFFADGRQDDIASLLLAAIADYVNEVAARKIVPDDKQMICNFLFKALRATANAHDIVSLRYDAETETVTALFESGRRRVINVAMDSGTAMIRDVMRSLGC